MPDRFLAATPVYGKITYTGFRVFLVRGGKSVRYVRFAVGGRVGYGVLEKDRVLELDGPGYLQGKFTGTWFDIGDVTLLAPVEPSKIVCVGLNYRDHAEELRMPVPEEPTIFLKPPSTVIGHRAAIVYPRLSWRVDYEAELAVVIGDMTRNVPANEARRKVFGYTCGNDVTARDLQQKDGQWTRAKSFDTFCPLGPWIETEVEAQKLGIYAYINGETRQASNTSQMLWSPEQLVSFISRIMTLYPGDVILTGTPSGVGELRVGDEVAIEIEAIGQLVNRVVGKQG